MLSPTKIIPESLMDRRFKGEVIKLLAQLPIDGEEKELIARGWAMLVGTKLTANQYRILFFSGVNKQSEPEEYKPF